MEGIYVQVLKHRRIGLPVIAVLLGHADAGGVILAEIGVIFAVSELFVAKIAGPSGLASTLPGVLAGAVDAPGVRYAFRAILTCPADSASAGSWSPTASVLPAASLRADCCNVHIFKLLYTQTFIASLFISLTFLILHCSTSLFISDFPCLCESIIQIRKRTLHEHIKASHCE